MRMCLLILLKMIVMVWKLMVVRCLIVWLGCGFIGVGRVVILILRLMFRFFMMNCVICLLFRK